MIELGTRPEAIVPAATLYQWRNRAGPYTAMAMRGRLPCRNSHPDCTGDLEMVRNAAAAKCLNGQEKSAGGLRDSNFWFLAVAARRVSNLHAARWIVTECYRSLVQQGFSAMARQSVTLSEVWWWVQNWARWRGHKIGPAPKVSPFRRRRAPVLVHTELHRSADALVRARIVGDKNSHPSRLASPLNS
jgi:hypothetical protein